MVAILFRPQCVKHLMGILCSCCYCLRLCVHDMYSFCWLCLYEYFLKYYCFNIYIYTINGWTQFFFDPSVACLQIWNLWGLKNPLMVYSLYKLACCDGTKTSTICVVYLATKDDIHPLERMLHSHYHQSPWKVLMYFQTENLQYPRYCWFCYDIAGPNCEILLFWDQQCFWERRYYSKGMQGHMDDLTMTIILLDWLIGHFARLTVPLLVSIREPATFTETVSCVLCPDNVIVHVPLMVPYRFVI